MCQSVSLLISLLKLDKYRDITNLDEISFWNFLETFLRHWFTSFYSAWLSLHIDFWVSVLVLTLKPLVLLPFGSLVVSFWDLWSCYILPSNSLYYLSCGHTNYLLNFASYQYSNRNKQLGRLSRENAGKREGLSHSSANANLTWNSLALQISGHTLSISSSASSSFIYSRKTNPK